MTQLQAEGWDVCVIATPQASRSMNLSSLAALSGHAVRIDYKLPGEADSLHKADAIEVVAGNADYSHWIDQETSER